ncbi:tol-pal system protein [Anaeromyxobacter oryzisoli]|uniref:tol-pal system protein n=1 Tax=Anaeromyxobacter oryzisoli TaxID=2925408 RepID=UPI001F56ADA1|nr:tol-pal system protein [Anaeromyxobacter sp. SG63]
MTLRSALRAAPALALLSLSACWVPLERGRLMETRLDNLEATQAEHGRRIEEQQKALQGRIAAADKKIAEVQHKIDELNQAARRSGADLGVQLVRLTDDVAKLRGEQEVTRHDLAELDRAAAAYRSKTDRRFAGLQGKGALDEVLAQERIDTLPKPDDRPAFLALAQKSEAAGDRGVARALYDEYVKRFPNDASAPEAAYRSGELLSAQKRWRDALVAYGWVYEHAPRSERLPDAMLGMGDAMLELEDLRKEAPVVLRELVTKFPKSPAAAKARERLARLQPPEPSAREPAERKSRPAAKKR